MKKDFEYQMTKSGVALVATVSPCVWMYEGYPLQVQLKMEGAGCAYTKNRSLTWDTATEADVIALAESVKLRPCKSCGKPAFDSATVETNRAGLCEHCFLSDLDRKYKEALKREATKRRAREARLKKRGYTHRVTAWVHPYAGDDDNVDFYFRGEPSKKQIQEAIAAAGSVVLDDYRPAEVI